MGVHGLTRGGPRVAGHECQRQTAMEPGGDELCRRGRALGLGWLAAKEGRGRAEALAQPVTGSSGPAIAYTSGSES